MNKPSTFVPFNHGITVDKAIGYNSEAAESDLTDEAMLRQSAANELLTVLSEAVDFGLASAGDIAGCFLAVKILAADATALREAAAECRRIKRRGGSE